MNYQVSSSLFGITRRYSVVSSSLATEITRKWIVKYQNVPAEWPVDEQSSIEIQLVENHQVSNSIFGINLTQIVNYQVAFSELPEDESSIIDQSLQNYP